MAGFTKTLGQLVTNLRYEVGQQASAAAGVNMRDLQVYVINRAQEELSLDWDWPALRGDRDVPITIGGRYYAYPDDMPFENINTATLIYTTLYSGLAYGIGPAELALYNSDKGFQSWPAQRWQHNTDLNQFELWPVPNTAPAGDQYTLSARVRLRGTRLPATLVNDSDVCVFPGTAVVLYAAAELLAREDAKDAQLKIDKAKEYLRRLRIRQSDHKLRPFAMGNGRAGPSGTPGLTWIPEGYGSGPARTQNS